MLLRRNHGETLQRMPRVSNQKTTSADFEPRWQCLGVVYVFAVGQFAGVVCVGAVIVFALGLFAGVVSSGIESKAYAEHFWG